MGSIDITWVAAGRALFGGVLIGLAAALLLAANGRIAGVSGIFGQLWTSVSKADRQWRWSFVLGLVAGGVVLSLAAASVFAPPITASIPQLVVAGALVGVGTQLANGCTSGHGICGIGRGSIRSIVATLSFMAAGMLIVAVVRVRFGGL